MNIEDSEAYLRFKLKTLLKRQIKRERKFQKRLADLRFLIDKYAETDAYESLLNLLNVALRVSDFHVAALKDILSDFHSPQFMRMRFGSMRPTEPGHSVTMEYGLNRKR
ncbi:hypothetical protein KEJ24_09035 [Candidatus Bathyarchaeota archaeon]|nr:hypothetical protein [Candidatus Bathyarchaeota archaeon]